jgi:translation initiation factor IF-2
MQTPRPPIIVILGHVDHGKTSLLDYLRKSNVVASEAGGITQHIRSFQITTPDSHTLTFIDTPGHAAFSQMRSRGSLLADIAILVVSSDDGVMPQTKESINFINQAKLPFVVALTKSDLSTASPDRVKTQLSEIGVIVEDFGGAVPAVSVSVKTGAGIPELLEIINLINELNPRLSDPTAPLQAIVLESRLDSKKGSLATVIVHEGVLSVGQNLFQKDLIGKARNLLDCSGVSIKTASASTPVEILGLNIVPAVGSIISSTAQSKASPTTTSQQLSANSHALNFIIKSDVAGSLEAIIAALDPTIINIISSGTGDVSESDVLSAQGSNSIILGFNVRVPGQVAKLAEVEKVTIRTFSIIYELLDVLDELLHPKNTEVITGQASILAEFKYESDRVAGCKCTSGEIKRGDTIKLMRGNVQVGLTKIKSIRTGKTTADKVKIGTEFGAVFSPHLDFKVNDSIMACSIHDKT